MARSLRSPRIARLSWGRLEIDDGRGFKDAKLYPGGAREWDWHETGTHHIPGIQPADVAELLDHGAEVVVLSKGVWERLRVCPETLAPCSTRPAERRISTFPRRGIDRGRTGGAHNPGGIRRAR
jgi:hypothetical protein